MMETIVHVFMVDNLFDCYVIDRKRNGKILFSISHIIAEDFLFLFEKFISENKNNNNKTFPIVLIFEKLRFLFFISISFESNSMNNYEKYFLYLVENRIDTRL